MACDLGSNIQCAVRCNDVPECDNGEDEQDCPGKEHIITCACQIIHDFKLLAAY